MATGKQKAIADVHYARELLEDCGEPELAAMLSKWLEEQEPKTVTVTQWAMDESLHFSEITRLVAQDDGGTWIVGTFIDGADYLRTDEGSYVTESPAEITLAARDVWPDFDCEGAEPRLQPMVTLHSAFDSSLAPAFSAITAMRPYGGCVKDACLVLGLCTYGDGSCSGTAVVTESPVRITELARAAWGADWSCPGAEPPVVVLPLARCSMQPTGVPNKDKLAFHEITKLQDYHTGEYVGCHVTGRWIVDSELFSDCKVSQSGVVLVKLSQSDIRAACAAAGVPCPAEELDIPEWERDCLTSKPLETLYERPTRFFTEMEGEWNAERDRLEKSATYWQGLCRSWERRFKYEGEDASEPPYSGNAEEPQGNDWELLVGYDPAALDGDTSVCLYVERKDDGLLHIMGTDDSIAPEIRRLQEIVREREKDRDKAQGRTRSTRAYWQNMTEKAELQRDVNLRALHILAGKHYADMKRHHEACANDSANGQARSALHQAELEIAEQDKSEAEIVLHHATNGSELRLKLSEIEGRMFDREVNSARVYVAGQSHMPLVEESVKRIDALIAEKRGETNDA